MILLSIIRYLGILVCPAIFLYKYMRVNYPDETNHLIQESLWIALKVETRVKIIFNQSRHCFNNNIFKPLYNYMYPINEQSCITFIKDGKEIESMTYNKVILTDESPEYDFILYEVQCGTINYLVRFNDINEIKEINTNDEYIPESSSVQFLSVEINVNDRNYKVITDDFNWYVNENILFDREFIHWYLFKYHSLDINGLENMNYTICLIDNNVKILTLTPENKLVIYKDTYEVF
jgi:hypothetical protein